MFRSPMKKRTFGEETEDFLSRPWPKDSEFIAILGVVGRVFRNGVVHISPEEPFTPPEMIRIVRKLILGLDEERIRFARFSPYIATSTWLISQEETKSIRDQLRDDWRKYPGLVRTLWENKPQETE